MDVSVRLERVRDVEELCGWCGEAAQRVSWAHRPSAKRTSCRGLYRRARRRVARSGPFVGCSVREPQIANRARHGAAAGAWRVWRTKRRNNPASPRRGRETLRRRILAADRPPRPRREPRPGHLSPARCSLRACWVHVDAGLRGHDAGTAGPLRADAHVGTSGRRADPYSTVAAARRRRRLRGCEPVRSELGRGIEFARPSRRLDIDQAARARQGVRQREQEGQAGRGRGPGQGQNGARGESVSAVSTVEDALHAGRWPGRTVSSLQDVQRRVHLRDEHARAAAQPEGRCAGEERQGDGEHAGPFSCARLR